MMIACSDNVCSYGALVSRDRRLLTIDKVAERLGLTPRSVRDKIKRGQIPALQLGGKRNAIRVDEGELEAWLYRGGM